MCVYQHHFTVWVKIQPQVILCCSRGTGLDFTKAWIGMGFALKKCRKRELLSLIGKLAHTCKVVPAGRSFLRRMIITAIKVKHMNHWVHLNADFRADLAWWDTFLESRMEGACLPCMTPGGSLVSHAAPMHQVLGVVGHLGKTNGFSSHGIKNGKIVK